MAVPPWPLARVQKPKFSSADVRAGIRRIARRPSVMRATEDGRYGALEIGRPIQPPMLLWPKPLDLRLERGFDRPVRRLNGDHVRPDIGDTASLADALDLRTLLREFASAQG